MSGPLPALLRDGELDGWRGAPFDERLLEVAVADIRGACGWHVAPVATTEALVSGPGGPRLVLPTLRLVELVTVADVRASTGGRAVAGWRRGAAGMVIREAGWPRGEDNLQVEMRHGYDECPPDLRAVVVERLRVLDTGRTPGTQSTTRTVGEVTRTTSITDSVAARAPAWTLAAEAILDRYRVT